MLGICFNLYFLCCVLSFCICHLPKYSESFPCPYLSWGRPTAMDTASLSNKQTKEKNRQSYLYPGGRPWAAYPFPTRLLPIEYFPLPPRNISRCHQGIFPTATTEYFPLLPRNISHCHQEKLYIFVTEPGFLPISYSPDLASICYLGCKWMNSFIWKGTSHTSYIQCSVEQSRGSSVGNRGHWNQFEATRPCLGFCALCILSLYSVFFLICGICFKENRPDHLSFYSIENV